MANELQSGQLFKLEGDRLFGGNFDYEYQTPYGFRGCDIIVETPDAKGWIVVRNRILEYECVPASFVRKRKLEN